MFCGKCGNQVPDGTKFCTKCGNKLELPDNSNVLSESQVVEEDFQTQIGIAETTLGQEQVKTAFTNQNQKKINLRPIVLVAIMALALIGAISKDRQEEKNIENHVDMDEWDPFDGLVVEFLGVEPNCKINIQSQPTPPDGIKVKYDIDKSEGLSSGDKVNIKVTYTMNTSAKKKYFIENESKEYELGDMAYYPSEIDQIPQDIMDKMKSYTMDAAIAYVSNVAKDTTFHCNGGTYVGTSNVTRDATLEKIYIATSKTGNGNYIVFLYSYDVEPGKGKYSEVSGWFSCSYKNVCINVDKSISVGYTEFSKEWLKLHYLIDSSEKAVEDFEATKINVLKEKYSISEKVMRE